MHPSFPFRPSFFLIFFVEAGIEPASPDDESGDFPLVHSTEMGKKTFFLFFN